jgi:cobalamin biosynthesis protein CbiG
MTPASRGRDRILVWALSRAGAESARRIAPALDAEIRVPQRWAAPGEQGFASLGDDLRREFNAAAGHVLFAAAGIVVRAIAPCLASKFDDPAVVVCDPRGRFAVSLLSGHVGGANDLARRAARALGGTAVITTASDACGAPAVDELARRAGLVLADPQAARRTAAALLAGEPVQLYDPEGLLGLDDAQRAHFQVLDEPGAWDPDTAGVWVHWTGPRNIGAGLALRPRRLFAGIGCRRGTSKEEILELVATVLQEAGLARESLAGLASIDVKRDEPGLVDAAAELGLKIWFYSADELDGVKIASTSPRVKRHVGTGSVCEAAAVLASQGGSLVVSKTVRDRATLAVAVSSR